MIYRASYIILGMGVFFQDFPTFVTVGFIKLLVVGWGNNQIVVK